MDPTPTTVVCSGACTVTHVISVDTPPFNLSQAEGAQIASAILAVWAIGFAVRLVIRALKQTDGGSTQED